MTFANPLRNAPPLVSRAVRAMVGASRDEVILATARAFGYARTGHHVEARMAHAVDVLLAKGRLVDRMGSLVTATNE